jgi:molybdenum cofactor guanylyltransferase
VDNDLAARAVLTGVTLAILAGGESSRMGRSKATLEIRGRPFLEFLLERLRWAGPTLLITAPGREHPPGTHLFTREAVDPTANEGPLRGLLTAMEHCLTPLLAVMPVDMPNLGPAQFAWLADRLGRDGLGVMTSRTVGGEPQIEPFPSVFSVRARAQVESHFATGARSLYSLSKVEGIEVVDAPGGWGEETWTNLNTPGEFEAFLQRLR